MMELKDAESMAQQKADIDRKEQSLWLVGKGKFVATSYEDGDVARPGFVGVFSPSKDTKGRAKP